MLLFLPAGRLPPSSKTSSDKNKYDIGGEDQQVEWDSSRVDEKEL